MRSKLLYFFVGLCFLAAVLIAFDFIIINLILDDGLGGLTTEERDAAEDALSMVNATCLDNPIARAVTRKRQIIEVTLVPGCKRIKPTGKIPDRSLFAPPESLLRGDSPYSKAVQGYQVVIQTYTFFGFLTVRIINSCDGNRVECERD